MGMLEVPMARNWSTRVRAESNLLLMTRIFNRYNEFLKDHFDKPWAIDEIAVLAPTHQAARNLCAEAVTIPGVEMFNVATDVVYVEPFITSYDVQYHFLRTDKGFRVEVMSLGSKEEMFDNGFSPLHSAMWQPRGSEFTDYPIVHASFKCQDLYEMAEAEQLLRLNGMHAQTCTSSYGRFSYWLPAGTEDKVFLKPRINTRDNPDDEPLVINDGTVLAGPSVFQTGTGRQGSAIPLHQKGSVVAPPMSAREGQE